jgi:hypothetical protein
MTDIVNIAQIIIAVIGIVGALVAVITWFYRRGARERAYTEALDRNTTANNQVATKLEDFRTVVLEMFHALDKRVTRVEDRLK